MIVALARRARGGQLAIVGRSASRIAGVTRLAALAMIALCVVLAIDAGAIGAVALRSVAVAVALLAEAKVAAALHSRVARRTVFARRALKCDRQLKAMRDGIRITDVAFRASALLDIERRFAAAIWLCVIKRHAYKRRRRRVGGA